MKSWYEIRNAATVFSKRWKADKSVGSLDMKGKP